MNLKLKGKYNNGLRLFIALNLILTIFVYSLVPSYAFAEVQPEESVMLVIDASGSMSGNKIVDAKNAASTFLDSIKGKSVEVGLIAFYDCNDIQVLHNLTRDIELVKSKISLISPYGGTPIADSIISAGNILKQSASGKKGRIILLTDGGESCGGDCKQASNEVKQIEIDVTLNIIGIEIPDSTIEEQLKDISDTYTPVEDSSGLPDIIEEIGQEIGKEPQKTISRMELTPNQLDTSRGDNIQLELVAHYQDGTSENINIDSNVTFSSSDETKAVVKSDGLVEIPIDAPKGLVYVRAIYEGQTVASLITVKVPESLSWNITNPNTTNLTMEPGDSLQMAVTGTMSDGTTEDLTAGSTGTTYASSSTSRATVTAEGLVEIPTNATNGIVYVRVYRGNELKPLTITIKAP